MPWEGQPFTVGYLPEFFDRFSRDLNLLRADIRTAVTTRTGEETLLNCIPDARCSLPGIQCDPHLGSHRGRADKIGDFHRRADRDTGEAFDAVTQGFDCIDGCRLWNIMTVTWMNPGDLVDPADQFHRQIPDDREIKGFNSHSIDRFCHTG